MNPYKALLVKKTTCVNETKMAIQKTFLVLYIKKDFQKITVKELCAEVPIARTTFYNHYQNTAEVIEEIENSIITDLLNINKQFINGNTKNVNLFTFFKNTLKYINMKYDMFYTLLINDPDIALMNKWKNAIKYHFYERYLKNKNNTNNVELTMEMIASAILGSYIYWLKNPHKVITEEVSNLILMMVTSIENNNYINCNKISTF